MPDPPAQQNQQAPQPSPTMEKGWDMFWNRFNRILGKYNLFRYRTYEGMAPLIIKILENDQIINRNNGLLTFLSDVEGMWHTMDSYLWDKNPSILKLYEQIGHYDDLAVIKLELSKYITGGDFGYDESRGGFYLEPVKLQWNDGNKIGRAHV